MGLWGNQVFGHNLSKVLHLTPASGFHIIALQGVWFLGDCAPVLTICGAQWQMQEIKGEQHV
jgi:hypothetical protein